MSCRRVAEETDDTRARIDNQKPESPSTRVEDLETYDGNLDRGGPTDNAKPIDPSRVLDNINNDMANPGEAGKPLPPKPEEVSSENYAYGEAVRKPQQDTTSVETQKNIFKRIKENLELLGKQIWSSRFK